MEVQFYKEYKDFILKNVPELESVRIWNNQFKRMNQENSFKFPLMFIEFNPVEAEYKLLEGIQGYLYNITLHIGFESYLDEDLRIFELKQKIHDYTQYFQIKTCTRLERVGQKPDFEHTSYQVYKMTYKTLFIDTDGQRAQLKKMDLNPNFKITYDK